MIPFLLMLALGSSAPRLLPGIPGSSLSFDERWRRLEATPRFLGSGGAATAVVVGRRGNDIYLLTSEHVTRRNTNLTLEFFDRKSYPDVARKVSFGHIMEEFPIPDLAVMKFPVTDGDFPVVRLASVPERPKRFPIEALTIGCTNGRPPTCESATINAKRSARRVKDEDVIAFFWETDRIPIPGRSGGPIFDGAGRLIGICSATTGGKGFYTHTDEILAALKAKNLAWLFEEDLPEVRKNR